MNDFPGFWICVCCDPIRVSASDVSLLLIFEDPTMEIVGVPFAYYYGISYGYGYLRFALQTSHQMTVSSSWLAGSVKFSA